MGFWDTYIAGQQSLGNAIDDTRKMNLMEEDQRRKNRLADLQLTREQLAVDEVTRKRSQDEELRNALSAARGTTTYTMPQPSGSLASLVAPDYAAAPAPFAMPQEQPATGPMIGAANTYTAPNLQQIAAQKLQEQGRFDEASKVMDGQVKGIAIDDLLTKKRAEIEMYGSPEAKAKLDIEETRLKTAGNLILTSRKADPSGGMTKQMIKAHPELFPGINPDLVVTAAGLTELPFNGGKLVIGPDGKTHVVQDKNDTKGFDTIDLGDRVKVVDRATGAVTYEKKALSPAAVVRIEKEKDKPNKLDEASVKTLLRTMPKLKEDAISANSAMDRIDTMLGLLDKGAGGRSGQLKAAIGPYAEMFGIKTQGLTDAQLYETLSKTIGGSLRMQIVGPGPVSNYENQLLQRVSGGGATGVAAAKELLAYYKSQGETKINDYNDSVTQVAEYSPATAKIYKPVSRKGPQPKAATQPAAATSGGKLVPDGKGGYVWRN